MDTNQRLADLKAKIERNVGKPNPRRGTSPRNREVLPQIQLPEVVVPAPVEKLHPRNAWDRMADLVVARTFAENKDLREAAMRPSAVIFVQTPGDWIHHVAEAWGRALYPEATFPLDGDDFDGPIRTHSAPDELSQWCEFRRDGTGKRSKSQGTNGLAWALSNGLPTYGFAPELGNLPASFARVYERHVVIRPPDGSIFADLVTAICGVPLSVPIPDDICDRITEADLLLAMRPDQTGDEYVTRVIELTRPEEPKQKGGITLDDLGGMEAAVAWGRALVTDIDDLRAGRISWAEVDPGVLLVGPPGCGKTTFARALAGSTGLPLVTGSLAEWQAAGHLGDLLKAMRGTFAEARKSAPSILFIDEIDSFASRAELGGNYRDYGVQVVNALLEELGGVKGRDGVIVVAACNDASRLDPALVRAGRLDRTIQIALPGIADLERIFRHHLSGDLVDQDLAKVADKALGRSGADVVQVVRDARRRARSERRRIEVADLIAVVDSNTPTVSPATLRRFAIHEAGHAVATAIKRPGALIGVTVRQTLSTGGYTATAPDPDLVVAGVDQLRAKMSILLSGRAAEELVLGGVSAGAGGGKTSDLAWATLFATLSIGALGLGGGSLVWLGEVTADNLEDFLHRHPGLADQVSVTLDDAYQDALALLRPKKAAIETLADMLVQNETISGEIVERLIDSHRHPRNAKIAEQDPSNERRKP